MKADPLALPLLELLEPYESYDAIVLALYLGAFDDPRWYWFRYTKGVECVHWWATGVSGSSFVAVYQGHVEVQVHGSRHARQTIQEALQLARGS